MYKFIFKRSIDFFGAICLIFAFSPVLLLSSFLTYLSTGSVFFTQERIGYKGKIFKIYKFKTMTDKRGINGEPLSDEERLTTVGSFLRKWSIDEFPGLINVLKGEMSLVGPRPIVKQYLLTLSENQLLRHQAIPGITGWAQVNGRNAISMEKRCGLDVWYVNHISFWLDLKILLLTPYQILKSEDINGEGQETLKAFDLY